MPLTSKQRAALEAKAKEAGVDAAELIAEAESLSAPSKDDSGEGDTKTDAAEPTSKEKPNLFMYLLPFVTVNEVRTIWLELGPVAGGDEYAEAFAAKQRGAGTKPPVTE